jgi:hypothetical protein
MLVLFLAIPVFPRIEKNHYSENSLFLKFVVNIEKKIFDAWIIPRKPNGLTGLTFVKNKESEMYLEVLLRIPYLCSRIS